jgi:soluble lytic murein transglycosylase-like protein
MRVRVSSLALVGLLLLIAFPAAASANYPHVIQRGETLTSVAAVDGLTISALAAANGMSVNSQLVAGQILQIPPRGVTPRTVTVTAQQTTTAQPVSTQRTAAPVTRSRSYGPVATAERVPGSEIAYIANANGVPASLAEAIGWQESGWNNAEVSNVGAVGVMQIVPSTWRWIDRYLTPAEPLGTASAAENVRGGVLLLHQLLVATGDSYALTAAGYFQGLASVRRYGMYRSTRQYVADVLALQQRLAG